MAGSLFVFIGSELGRTSADQSLDEYVITHTASFMQKPISVVR